MPSTEQEAKWLAEFEEAGATEIRDRLNFQSINPEQARRLAVIWLREQDKKKELREERTLRWAKVAGWAGIVSIIVTAIGIAIAVWIQK
jgi:hypothetical protein